MLTIKKKKNIIKKVQIHNEDTGSADVQIGLLSKKIEELSAHLKKNKKDVHSRRGLLQMVADRRTHLKYLKKKDGKRYRKVIKEFELKSK